MPGLPESQSLCLCSLPAEAASISSGKPELCGNFLHGDTCRTDAGSVEGAVLMVVKNMSGKLYIYNVVNCHSAPVSEFIILISTFVATRNKEPIKYFLFLFSFCGNNFDKAV